MRSTILICVVAAACGTDAVGRGGDDDGGGGSGTPSALCSTGKTWRGEESALMKPGGDCIGCHAQSGGEAPHFTVAGTVQGALDDPDDCYGVPGVAVSVTDSANHTIQMVTNTTGNFFSNTAMVMPITSVTLQKDGATNVMTFTPDVGACASCHTATGLNDAPGRIVAP